jgi:hypothetical protein
MVLQILCALCQMNKYYVHHSKIIIFRLITFGIIIINKLVINKINFKFIKLNLLFLFKLYL